MIEKLIRTSKNEVDLVKVVSLNFFKKYSFVFLNQFWEANCVDKGRSNICINKNTCIYVLIYTILIIY